MERIESDFRNKSDCGREKRDRISEGNERERKKDMRKDTKTRKIGKR